VAVYVNGRKTDVKPKEGAPGEFPMSVKAPADIVVILRPPPAALAELHQAALLRVTETDHPVDYYRPEAISDQADGGTDEHRRPVLQDAAVSAFGFNFGGRKHIHVPVAAPAESEGGILRVHLPMLEKYGRKWNHRIAAVEVNLQPLAISHSVRQKIVFEHKGAAYERDVAVAGNLTIPPAIDIPLAPGEVKLLSVHTQPFVAESFGDFAKVTTRLAVEWVPGAPEGD
jgi:hypothetical protein